MLAPSIAAAISVLAATNGDWYAPSSFPQYPALTPDGAHLVYSDRGDLWTTPSTGGTATRLTSHPALELRSAISPDGSMLAFSSDRDGVTNLYVMPIALSDGRLISNGPIRRVTTSDRTQILSGFTPDGQALLFHAYGDPSIYRMPMMYQAPLDGGPVTLLTAAHGREPRMHGTDGRVLFTRGSAPWERPAYRGSANREVWSYDPNSNEFERLTNAPSNDGQAHDRPDGSIALVSSRDGQNDVLIMAPGGDLASARNLTNLQPTPNGTIGHGARDLTISADGSTAAYGLWDRLQVVDLNAPTPTPKDVQTTASGDVSTLDRRLVSLNSKVSEVAPHPSGEAVAVVARGEILVRNTDDDHPTRRVTNDHARQRHIAWAPDGSRLWFTSDHDGHDAIWEATVAFTRADLEPEEEEDTANDTLPSDEPAASEEANTSESSEEAPETANAPASDPEAATTELETSGDEPTDEDADAKDTEEADKEKENNTGEAWADALTFSVQRVIDGPHASRPMPSPDGRRLLYQRDRGDLVLRDLATGEDHLLLESWDEPEVRWASDSQHIVYSVADLDFNSDVWLMDVDHPEQAVNLTRHPDIDRAPRISDDGSRLVFLSDRSRIGDNWEWDVWTIPLDKSMTKMTDYQLTERIDDAKKKAGKKKIIPLVDHTETSDDEDETPTVLEFADLDTAWTRARRMTSHEGAESDLEITAGGDRVIYSGEIDGSSGLWSVDHQGEDRKKIASGSVSNVRADAKGKRLSYVASGKAKHASTTGGKEETWAVDADARIEVAAEQGQKFDETARTFGQSFYHPTMKDLDWPQLSAQYRDLATTTRTSQAFNRVVDHLFGEANGSHTGIYGGFSHDGPRLSVGYLGVETAIEPNGYRVTRVIEEGPADTEHGLAVGDVITKINGRDMSNVDLRTAMEGTSGEETLITVLTEAGDERLILTTPISWGGWSSIMRADEIKQRREHVANQSDDRLGYLHIRGMNMPSVHQFEQDLYAAAHGKDGLIIDVRDNGGGFTTDILLSSLTAPTHAYTIPRGADVADVRPDSYPRDRRLIYAYSRPIVVLCNENSFSNAEIFSHAIQNTGRGTLIGEETYGGVISTGAFTLIDGARVRQPFRGWYLQDGTDMESRGAIPDIRVERTPSDEAAEIDRQLDRAIDVLMESATDGPTAVHPRPAS